MEAHTTTTTTHLSSPSSPNTTDEQQAQVISWFMCYVETTFGSFQTFDLNLRQKLE